MCVLFSNLFYTIYDILSLFLCLFIIMITLIFYDCVYSFMPFYVKHLVPNLCTMSCVSCMNGAIKIPNCIVLLYYHHQLDINILCRSYRPYYYLDTPSFTVTGHHTALANAENLYFPPLLSLVHVFNGKNNMVLTHLVCSVKTDLFKTVTNFLSVMFVLSDAFLSTKELLFVFIRQTETDKICLLQQLSEFR